MQKNKVLVTADELQELQKLAHVIKNAQLPLSHRRIAKSQYESIIKYAKQCQRGLV